jgi:hypothetical protein
MKTTPTFKCCFTLTAVSARKRSAGFSFFPVSLAPDHQLRVENIHCL